MIISLSQELRETSYNPAGLAIPLFDPKTVHELIDFYLYYFLEYPNSRRTVESIIDSGFLQKNGRSKQQNKCQRYGTDTQ